MRDRVDSRLNCLNLRIHLQSHNSSAYLGKTPKILIYAKMTSIAHFRLDPPCKSFTSEIKNRREIGSDFYAIVCFTRFSNFTETIGTLRAPKEITPVLITDFHFFFYLFISLFIPLPSLSLFFDPSRSHDTSAVCLLE